MNPKVLLRLLSGVLAFMAVGSIAWAAAKKDPSPPKAPATATAAPAGPGPGVVATVGDVKITDEELMSSLPLERQRAFEGAYKRIQDLEREAMQEVFAQRYVEQQARALGVSVDAYYEREIAANRDGFSTENKSQIIEVKRQIYDAKRMALDDLVGSRLEEKEAKAKGITVEDLIREQVEPKVGPVTAADVDLYYTQNARMFGGQPKDAVAPQIEQAIRANRLNEARGDYRDSLRAGTPVKVYLEVPRIPVSIDDDPIKGARDAPIQIVVFSEFQ